MSAIHLRASDGTVVSLGRATAEASAPMLQGWMDVCDAADEAFPVPFKARTLSAACSMLEAPSNTKSRGVFANAIATRGTQSLEDILDVMHFAAFLCAEELMDMLAMVVARRLNGKWDVEIRDLLGVRCDMTLHERDQTAREGLSTLPRHLPEQAHDGLTEVVAQAALRHVDTKTIIQFKLVSRAWRERARKQLRARSRRGDRAYWAAFAAEQTQRVTGGRAHNQKNRVAPLVSLREHFASQGISKVQLA